MIVVCVQFSFNISIDEFNNVFKFANDVINEININILRNAILLSFE